MKFSPLFLFVVSFALQCDRISSYKILGFFPIPLKSHYFVGHSLMKGLADAGHDVTFISPFQETKPKLKNFNEIRLTGVEKSIAKTIGGVENPFEFNNRFIVVELLKLFKKGNAHTNATLQNPKFQAFLQSNAKFDVIVVEIFLADAFLGLGHHFKAPVIGVSTFGASKWTCDLVGTPIIPSYVPHTFTSHTDRMTFFERAYNLLYYIVEDVMTSIAFTPQQKRLLKQGFPDKDMPTINQLKRNVSLVLLNTHVSLGTPRPYAPNMIEVGGMHINRKPKPLPEQLKRFLDNAKNGAIYFSLGSIIEFSKMSSAKKTSILNAFAAIPNVRLLLKIDENVTIASHKGSDVLIQDWFPQESILAHPNVKVFITHGGLLSTMESLYYGKPIVVIPVFGDQNLNMQVAMRANFGEGVPYEKLNSENLKSALLKVLKDPKYSEKAKSTSIAFRDQIKTPLEIAVFWVEHVAKTKGAPHLRSAAVDLPLYAYYNLDIYAFVISIAFAFYYAAMKGLEKLKSKSTPNLKKKTG